MKQHVYQLKLTWEGNTGKGTETYTSYKRDYRIEMEGKQKVDGSADPAFRGDKEKINPEEMLLSALSSCHMLWFLHLCADHGINVITYTDEAVGRMEEYPEGGGRFTEVTLKPRVRIENKDQLEHSKELHLFASQKCFIANSCNFPVHIECQHQA